MVTAASLSVGYFGLVSTESAQLRGLDVVLDAGAQQISEARQSPLTAALLVADQSQVALTIALRDINTATTTLRYSRATVNPKTALSVLRQAATEPITAHYRGDYRMRTVALPENEFIIVATTLADVEATKQRGIRFLLLALAISVAVGVSAIALLIRRDLKVVESLIHAAGTMATGDTDVVIATGSSTSEVDSLARALRSMVDSLNDVVRRERNLSLTMQSFLGDASHELRTPLTVVRGYFELLSMNPAFQGETERRYLQRIGSEIARMETLISDLLLLTETGNQPLPELTDVNASILVHQFVEDLRALNPDRLVVDQVADGVVVRGSEPLLAQMCSNVYRNIEVHVPATAPVRIELSAHAQQAVLTIDDGGSGLSTDMYAAGIHAFQRFDPSRSRETGGSGLGMSIIAAIVGQHGGQIALSPSDLGGLRTTISLPMRQQAGVEQ